MFCYYCGSPNPDDASFCGACGKRLVRPAQASVAAGAPEPLVQRQTEAMAPPLHTQPQSVSGGKTLPILLTVGAVAVLVVAAVVLQGSLSKPQDDPSLFAPPSMTGNVAPFTPIATGPTTPAPGSTPAPSIAPSPEPAPAPALPPPAPVVPPAAPAPVPLSPQAQIVGEWRTDLLIGQGTLELTRDGRYRVINIFVDETGIYTYASDGTLRLQVNGIFDHTVTVWHAQLSADGESLSVVEPEGGAHVYRRVHD